MTDTILKTFYHFDYFVNISLKLGDGGVLGKYELLYVEYQFV